MLKTLLNGLLRRPRKAAPGSPALAGVESARQLFGRLRSKRDLVAAATARSGPHLAERFRTYVALLRAQGYEFGSCEEASLRLDRRRVYLRYDVHVRDLFGAFALAALHEELQIPGSFQICWEHSRAEVEASDIFLKLQGFDSRYVEFGLHCSPESRWLIADRFDGRGDGLEAFVNDGGARAMMIDWLAAFRRDGDNAPVLGAARARAEDSLAELTVSFRRRFGAVRTVSGHGTPLSAAFLDAVEEDRRLSDLASYLHPVDFLTRERIAKHGFACELTTFDADPLPGPCIMFEGPIGDMASRYRARMAASGGFVVLFHPASWTGDYFVPFLADMTAPAPADAPALGANGG